MHDKKWSASITFNIMAILVGWNIYGKTNEITFEFALILAENTFAVRAVGAQIHTQDGSKNSPVFSITDGKVYFTPSSRFSTDIYLEGEHTSLPIAFTSLN